MFPRKIIFTKICIKEVHSQSLYSRTEPTKPLKLSFSLLLSVNGYSAHPKILPGGLKNYSCENLRKFIFSNGHVCFQCAFRKRLPPTQTNSIINFTLCLLLVPQRWTYQYLTKCNLLYLLKNTTYFIAKIFY